MKNPKVFKAFNAMKNLGIAHETVKPVLKQLLKVYDKNWEFIEAENYRALVDAIFEYEEKEKKKVDGKRMQSIDCDVSEPPQKKLHGVPEEDEASSTVGSGGVSVFSKEGDVPSSSCPSGIPNTFTSVEKMQVEPDSCSAVNKGKVQPSSIMISSSVKIKSERASSSPCSKFPLTGSGPVIVDLEEIPVRGSTSKFQSDLMEGSLAGNLSAKASVYDLENPKESISACNFQRTEQRIDIASLLSGHVKLCCVLTLEKATSQTPDMDAVLKLVEEEFLRTYKIQGPPFSLKTLFEDVCKRFSELTNDRTYQTIIRTSPEVTAEDILRGRKETVRELFAINKVQNEQESEAETSQIFQDGMKRLPQVYVDDITKGEENVKISLVDELGNRQPPKFFYIPRNLIYQKAIVNISLARISDEDCCPNCSGDCLSSPVPCACARVTNGEYAYTKDGLLKPEFLEACISENKYVYCQDCPIEKAKNGRKPGKCKGHSVKKFIKECWSKCGCSTRCGNRVVQRGISRNLQVFWTPEGKGWGLRALEDLPKGAFVCEYVGEVVTNTELDERNTQSRGNDRHTYPVQLDADWGSESILDDDFALCLDATNYGNVGRFINHTCCTANLFDIPVEVESADHHYYHLAFFTKQEVKAFEELTWDYKIDFDDDRHPVKAFQCRCGSPFCRFKTRKGSKSRSRASTSTR